MTEALPGTPHKELDDDVFFKRGIIGLHVPAVRGNDTSLNKAQAAAFTREANRAEVLKSRFVDAAPLFRQEVPGQGMVQIIMPSAPYAYGGVMVVAVGENLMTAESAALRDMHIANETAFDIESEARVEYYRQIIASIQAEEDVHLPRQVDTTKVMACENTIADISNEHCRLPRTLVLAHAHVIKDGDWVDEGAVPYPQLGFSLEQRISRDQDLFRRFKNHWQTAAGQDSTIPSSLLLRGDVPYGYTIAIPSARDEPLEAQAYTIANALLSHHTAYASFAVQEAQRTDARRWERRQAYMKKTGSILPRLRPVAETLTFQPSYRTYIYYKNGYLAATISPLITTTRGTMEGMESAVDRGLHNKNKFSDAELAAFSNNLADRLRMLLCKGYGAAM